MGWLDAAQQGRMVSNATARKHNKSTAKSGKEGGRQRTSEIAFMFSSASCADRNGMMVLNLQILPNFARSWIES
jgi:hypothetical protein